MDCTTIREACSATLDGEPSDVPPGAIADHLRTCVACRGFVDDIRAVRGTLSAGDPWPDATSLVLSAARRERHQRGPRTTVLRLGLVAVAAAQLGIAIPALLQMNHHGHGTHNAHEVAACDIALAVGFLFAAARPLRALGLLPLAGALSLALVVTAVVDLVNGEAVALTEAPHTLALIGTALLWLLVQPGPRPRSRTPLRVV
jgi:predicted anti-sigma-YlaC factor YlaD